MAHPPRLFSEYFRLKDIVELDGDKPSSLRDQHYPFDDLKEELLYPSFRPWGVGKNPTRRDNAPERVCHAPQGAALGVRPPRG
jgi:hypothetical protein